MIPAFLLFLICLARFQAAAQLYPKIEAAFSIPNLATDPFDYTQTDVRVQIAQPDGTTNSLPAFFDGGTTWRVRHSPPSPGLYQVAGIKLNGQVLTVTNLQPASWAVAGWPTSPGFVRVDPVNTNRFLTSNGQRYFPVGHDVAWDVTSVTNVVSILAKLGATHENWSRIWMDDWDGKNLDWPRPGGPFGTLNLAVAQKWDAIVAAADQSGVSFQMTLQHHGQYSSNVDPEWSYNPYNATNGGFLTNATQFFTNSTALALTQRKLRYAVARWGYSPSIMAWELFNEVQFTDAAQAGLRGLVQAWHNQMAQFLRSQDAYGHLITTSSDLSEPIWDQCDYYTHHDYPSDLISVLFSPPGIAAGDPTRPIFGSETGSDPTVYYGVSAPLWAGLMGAQSGAAEPWYWDRIDAEGDYPLLKAWADFVRYAGIADQNTLVQTTPHVTCPVESSLNFSPGGGWATATQDTFTVGDAAPSGLGNLPSYLQGNYHRSMTPNGYTFLVNYGQAGTFSVQVVQIAASGAGLTITVDNSFSNSVSWPSSGSDQSTNFTLTVNVSAGAHTINLWNPGQDWVNLGEITLDPYVSILGAYQIASTNFAALWLWHRTNIYNPTASLSVSGTLPLSGLQPGTYAATWWDTFAGVALSNFTFAVSGTNGATLATPAILRSIALFAGPPAQAAISAPHLTQTLGTNSPPLLLPLVITNRGGLPLACSLSVTGAVPVAYSALNSTQPGGPVFAWKDISAVGLQITNFTTLASPRSARDEGIAGPINIGFNFPFFSGAQAPGVFSQLYVSPNGFVAFSPFTGNTATNLLLPNAQAPANLIAFFWRDLDLSTAGQIYALTDPINGTFTLQFQNAPFRLNPSSTVTCQLILKTTGEILLQYQSMSVSNTCTVGVQNAARNQGLTVAFDQNYLQGNFAVRLTPVSWLGIAANALLVPRYTNDTVNLSFNPAGLAPGPYTANLLVQTADPALPSLALPATLNIVNAPYPPALTNLNWTLAGGHLTVTFQRTHPAPQGITYLFDVTTNLLTGPWQSGPGFITQSTNDNRDGTETVTLIDSAAVPSLAAHYLRIRISEP